MTTLYVSGPMSSVADLNYPEFHRVSALLRDGGYEVISPAELDADRGVYDESRYEEYLAGDLIAIDKCDGIATLQNWGDSKGARLEVAYAKAHGKRVLSVSEWLFEATKAPKGRYPYRIIADDIETPEKNILQEAEGLIHGDRQADYGHPYDDFSRTATIWSAVLGCEVTPEQVPLCMIGVKISRLCQHLKRDSVVDLAGYAGTLELVVERKGGWK